MAIVNLLRTLSFFDGLGDGELRKMAALFTQKFYKPGENLDLETRATPLTSFMRGQINIALKEDEQPIATLGSGAIFGAAGLFLDDSKRSAFAIAGQPSIVLVIQRAAFSVLAQTEPHLGLGGDAEHGD